jgi:hypothetical protein
MSQDDDGYRCVTAWLHVATYDGDGNPIPPEKRTPISDTAHAYCLNAQSYP